MEHMWIGFDDAHERVVWEDATRKQIEKLMTYELALIDENGNKVNWKDINDPEEDRTLLEYIAVDRRIREHNLMADRPPFAIATIEDGKITRLEFYQGHDALDIIFDIRSAKNKDMQLEKSYKGA